MNFLTSLHHIAIICSNYTASKKFYTELLGLKIENEVYREERNSYKLDLSLNGILILELFSFPNVPPRPSKPEAAGLRHLAFKVNNLNNALTHLRNNNIAFETIRTDEHTGKKFTFFADPDNLPIELYEA